MTSQADDLVPEFSGPMGAFSLQPGTDADVDYDDDVNDKLPPIHHVVEYTEPTLKQQQQKRVARQGVTGPPSRLPGRRPVQSTPAPEVAELAATLTQNYDADELPHDDQYQVDEDFGGEQAEPMRRPPPQQQQRGRGPQQQQQQRQPQRPVSRSPLRNVYQNGHDDDDDDVTGIDKLTPVAYFDVHSKNVKKYMREMADALATFQESMLNANRSMAALEKTKVGQRQARPQPPPQKGARPPKQAREVVNDF